jgi:hypothetical protein
MYVEKAAETKFVRKMLLKLTTTPNFFRPRAFCSSLTRDDRGRAKNLKHSAKATFVLSVVGKAIGLLQILFTSKAK